MDIPSLPERANQDNDLKAVQEMFGPAFAELAGMFRVDTPKRIAALHEAIAIGDAGEIATIAHVLSGSAISMGAKHLSALCTELEQRSTSGSLEDAGTRLTAIEEEYAGIQTQLRSMVDQS